MSQDFGLYPCFKPPTLQSPPSRSGKASNPIDHQEPQTPRRQSCPKPDSGTPASRSPGSLLPWGGVSFQPVVLCLPAPLVPNNG